MFGYTYYSSPWMFNSGDSIRIHGISRSISNSIGIFIVYNLSHLTDESVIIYKDNVYYVTIPRKFHNLIAKLVKWKSKDDLNLLIKITHYIDEFILSLKLLKYVDSSNFVYIFGSMSLFSFFINIFKIKSIVIYDPLANYAQSLYFLSRNNIKTKFKYGLYLALHKLQLKKSNYVVYPSKIDLETSKRMFEIDADKVFIIPNPVPICYESIKYYIQLRSKRKNFDKPYFALIAGSRSGVNKDAVLTTIKIFNKIPTDRFKLFITGPWNDMKNKINNESIELLGLVSNEKLKEILAMSDYGLTPIFGHVAGTFLKSLAYIASGLNLITTPWGIVGIDTLLLKGRKILIVKNKDEYKKAIKSTIYTHKIRNRHQTGKIAICDSANEMDRYVQKLLATLKTK